MLGAAPTPLVPKSGRHPRAGGKPSSSAAVAPYYSEDDEDELHDEEDFSPNSSPSSSRFDLSDTVDVFGRGDDATPSARRSVFWMFATSICLGMVMLTIAGTYSKARGVFNSKSGFGCDFDLPRPHVGNRSIKTSYCVDHRPLTPALSNEGDPYETGTSEEAVKFLVLGDFGRDGFCCQRDVAVELARAAQALQPAFVLNVGDAFYDSGVLSPHEEQVSTSWRDMYTGLPGLETTPWFSTLGNHEYRGSAEAYLNLSAVHPEHWVMEGRYWERVVEANGVKLHVVVLDTSPMIAMYRDPKYEGGMLKQPDGISTQWDKIDAQIAWLDDTLSRSSADVKVVVGHHPPYTSGSHYREDEGFLRTRIAPVIEKHGVSAYFGGHDHNLQHHWRTGGKTHYFVSAGGSKVEGAFFREDEGLRFFDQINGFLAVAATKEYVRVSFVDISGTPIYRVDCPVRKIGL